MSVRFESVTKRFAQTPVVDNLDLACEDGEFVVLLGPSGCGKTTTLRMLAGLEEVSSGDIFIGPDRVNDVPTRHRDVAMVFQSYALYPHMSVAENISYPLRVRKTPRDETERRVRRVAEMLEIGRLLARKPRELSGGERQRVALARAVVREPRVYLMDEPLSNLDAKLRVQMRGELKRLQRELATTTVYVTHDQAEAMTLAHRVAVMRDGKLQQFDAPMNIYNRPANRFVAEFVGSPGMNFIEGRIDRAARAFESKDAAWVLPPEQLDGRLDRAGGERVMMGIRPEHVAVSTTRREGWLPARVHVTELMGNETLVFLRLGGEKIIARAPAEFRADMETPAWVRLDLEKAAFFDAETGESLRPGRSS
ncbi:MAG TPA: ABC transporter ATP-binding protein [Blastocatellia bacterium]|nr:ABC transporter ATP-binding protein [Blastocatellia bacterium]